MLTFVQILTQLPHSVNLVFQKNKSYLCFWIYSVIIYSPIILCFFLLHNLLSYSAFCHNTTLTLYLLCFSKLDLQCDFLFPSFTLYFPLTNLAFIQYNLPEYYICTVFTLIFSIFYIYALFFLAHMCYNAIIIKSHYFIHLYKLIKRRRSC